MLSLERVVSGRFLFDKWNGGVWRIAVELAPGRVAFVTVPDGVMTLRGLRRIDCRIAQTSQLDTSRLKILHPDGHVLFERELYGPEEAWRPVRAPRHSVGA
jgi:hypothetical protein